MIPANELRLGNIVFAFKGYWTIEPNDFRYVDADDGNLPYEAIPLTPEVLEACGFKYEEWDQFSQNQNKVLYGKAKGYVLDNVYCFLQNWGFPGYFGRRNTNFRFPENCWNFNEYGQVTYLHQLQNLYFAIQTEELTVKETNLVTT